MKEGLLIAIFKPRPTRTHDKSLLYNKAHATNLISEPVVESLSNFTEFARAGLAADSNYKSPHLLFFGCLPTAVARITRLGGHSKPDLAKSNNFDGFALRQTRRYTPSVE